MPRISMRGAEGSAFTPMPKGTYNFRITEVKETVAKSSQNPQLEISFTVEDEDSQYNGRNAKDWIPLTPNAAWKLESLLDAAIPGEYDKAALDETDDKGRPLFEYEFDTDDLIDAEFQAKATIEEDNNGNDRNRFQYQPKKVEAAETDEADDEDEAEEEAQPAAKASKKSEKKSDKAAAAPAGRRSQRARRVG